MGSGDNSGVRRDQLVTIGDLENFKQQLVAEISLLLNEKGKLQGKRWLRSSEVRQLLGISSGTLQNFRVNGTLSHTKVGGIVFYQYDEIASLMEGRKVNKNNGNG